MQLRAQGFKTTKKDVSDPTILSEIIKAHPIPNPYVPLTVLELEMRGEVQATMPNLCWGPSLLPQGRIALSSPPKK
jgi:hypothetical protein